MLEFLIGFFSGGGAEGAEEKKPSGLWAVIWMTLLLLLITLIVAIKVTA